MFYTIVNLDNIEEDNISITFIPFYLRDPNLSSGYFININQYINKNFEI